MGCASGASSAFKKRARTRGRHWRPRDAKRGEDSEALNAWTNAAITLALLPFALSLATDLWIHVESAFGPVTGALTAGLGGLASLLLWYGPAGWQHSHRVSLSHARLAAA